MVKQSEKQLGRKKLKSVVGLVVVAALILCAIIGHSAIARQLHSWKLLPEPERLTELYFTDHTKLPTSYAVGDTQSVDFTVHNLEYRTTKYTYQIIINSVPATTNAVLVAPTEFLLSQNQYKKLNIPITLPDCGQKCKVRVQLNTGESIYYLLDEEGV